MEIYAKLGLDGARARARQARGTAANFWSRGRRTARIPLGDIGRDLSPYPVPDDPRPGRQRTSARRRAARPRPRRALEHRADRPRTEAGPRRSPTAASPTGSTHTLEARWVAGCDGARSAVRELNGIGFPGAPYQHVFFIADTMTGPMVPTSSMSILLYDGFHLIFPMRGQDHWRLVGILPPELRGRDDLTFEQVMPDAARAGGRRTHLQRVPLVLDLPHPSPRAPSASARAAASCSAMLRTSTARSARRA